MKWQIRRELWENRSVTIAPLLFTGFFLLAFLFSLFRLPERMRALDGANGLAQWAAIQKPYSTLAGLLLMVSIVVAFFYCLDALYGERRDRSILFWKSLPVSDRDTVLSKLAIPLVVLPLLVFITVLIAHLFMLIMSSVVMLVNGVNPLLLWTKLPIVRLWLVFLYGIIVATLWHAPIYAWFLLISGWAKRAVAVWALLPPLILVVVERGAFGSRFFGDALKGRITGFYGNAFITPTGRPSFDPLAYATPGVFLRTPGLWLGVIVAAILIVVTIRIRRKREPI